MCGILGNPGLQLEGDGRETGREKNEEKEEGGAGKGKEEALFLPLPLTPPFLVFLPPIFLPTPPPPPLPVEALCFRGCLCG